ncbi:MAG: hypothetical protein NZ455_09800 [Bacteroidia bacterium]|nr:hypothetical protein [Bacteroidia bacterium]MDW8345574.1 hypothetical protein [Bacteroidia bacterium]
MGVSLAALGSGYCALRVRFGASLRCALPDGMLRIPHAAVFLIFYFVFMHILALPCLIFIFKHVQS